MKEEELAQYIVVRRDLPLGTMLAMVAHAAGESYGAFVQKHGSLDEPVTVVVLGVRNEERLRGVARRLQRDQVRHAIFEESDEPFGGQLMALASWPWVRKEIAGSFEKLAPVREALRFLPFDDDGQ